MKFEGLIENVKEGLGANIDSSR